MRSRLIRRAKKPVSLIGIYDQVKAGSKKFNERRGIKMINKPICIPKEK